MTRTTPRPNPPVLEEQETRLSALRAALAEGEASGPSTPFDFDAFLEGKRKQAE